MTDLGQMTSIGISGCCSRYIGANTFVVSQDIYIGGFGAKRTSILEMADFGSLNPKPAILQATHL